MTQLVQLKRSYTSGSVPPSLSDGEFAWNLPDKVLYYKDGNGNIFPLPFGYSVDPLAIANAHPTFDFQTTRPDAVPAGLFSRLSSGYRTLNSGLIQSVAAGSPRIDHDPISGSCLGTIFEESRTNLLLNSNAFSASSWSLGSGSSVTQNATGPDGVANSAWTAVVSPNGPGLYSAVSATNGSAYAQSVWLRTTSGTAQLYLMTYAGSGSSSASLITVTATWQRFTLPWTGSSGTQYFELRTDYPSALSSATVQIYGAQLELGPFATSYIPTGSASATRAADILTAPMTSDWYNGIEGTVFVDFSLGMAASQITNSLTLFGFSDSPGNNTLYVQVYPNSALVVVLYSAGQQVQTMQFGAYSGPGRYRMSLGYKGAALAASLNGNAPSTMTSAFSVSSAYATVTIGSNPGNTSFIDGDIGRLAYVPRAQTTAILQRMTS